jgi:copper chaperone
MKKKILIEGMSCSHCINHVKGALEDLGASDIQVSLEQNMATAEFANLSDESIKITIEDAGYDVVEIESI